MPLMRIILILVLCLYFPACKTAKSLYKISITPDVRMGQEISPPGNAVNFEKEGIWGAVRPVSCQDLTAPSSLNREWDFKNPFEGIYDEAGMPIAFYLLIENRSDSSITFNPSSSFSLTDAGAPLFTIEYDDLYQDLYDSEKGAGQLENIRKMLFRSYQTLGPGEHALGLLLFRRPDEPKIKSKELSFHIHRIYAGSREINFAISFKIRMEEIPDAPPDETAHPQTFQDEQH